jgi:GT2 family glycosyltransferase
LKTALSDPLITVAIPSLRGGPLLCACLESLSRQTYSNFEIVVIDDTGAGSLEVNAPVRILRSPDNLGFGAAINQAWKTSSAPFLATLNDDAEASPEWLSALLTEMQSASDVGMCASQVRRFGTNTLDSAGILIALDGSSKQRGQGRPVENFARAEDVLLPSGSAALYRREMLEDIGLFDEDFFLYCEDTDLGLRARRNGWTCRYAPQAVVQHHYSQSAGAASPLKAWYVERNRLWVAVKNFPMPMLIYAPFHAKLRYLWHAWFLLRGEGSAARMPEGTGLWNLMAIIVQAHWSLVTNSKTLLRKRRAIQKTALLTDRQFICLLKANSISEREIARL